MSQVVSRVRVDTVLARAYGPAEVNMSPVYATEENDPAVIEEIRQFFEATPSGKISLNIANEAAAEHFQPGDEFYMRFERIAKPEEK